MVVASDQDNQEVKLRPTIKGQTSLRQERRSLYWQDDIVVWVRLAELRSADQSTSTIILPFFSESKCSLRLFPLRAPWPHGVLTLG